jgi:hypothetical protein
MLDGGRAKEIKSDQNIKHITHFESKIICKLINSPDYLGRAYSCKRKDPEKYIKNKQICRLIDEIRYNTGSKEKDYARKYTAKLHYKGFFNSHLNGGNANSLYEFADQLDLGDAGPDSYERLIPRVPKLEDEYGPGLKELEYRRENSAKLHYKDYLEPKLNGGNANASYETEDRIDLGGAGPKCGEVLVPHIGHIH